MATKTFTQFRVDNTVTVLPTTLPYGAEVYYKDANGVMTLYVGDEDGNAQKALPLATPARKIYVFGDADDSFPYFSTFANALTYANSLTPSTANPVSIVLLSNTNGTPVEISGASDWYALCLAGINVSSPYREIFSTTTLPTTLPKGMRVMYVDGNGVESLWVGRADGSAWPSVGYKSIQFSLNIFEASVVLNVLSNNTGIEFEVSGYTRSFPGKSNILFNITGDNVVFANGYLYDSINEGFLDYFFSITPLNGIILVVESTDETDNKGIFEIKWNAEPNEV